MYTFKHLTLPGSSIVSRGGHCLQDGAMVVQEECAYAICVKGELVPMDICTQNMTCAVRASHNTTHRPSLYRLY